ncbi:MAG TPA: hypothetical protein VH111_12080, partial [Steroidobacteraceae bacterium]|nr:hypothetical protein [Steroidobacteraceae bacterium]
SQCEAFGLRAAEAAADVVTVIEVVNGWKEHFEQAGVSERDIESLAERIDGGALLAQRTDFTPERFASAQARPGRKSPFRRS